MYRLKLARGLSYIGHGLNATKKEPYVNTPDKSVADYLVESKHFELVDCQAQGSGAPPGVHPQDGSLPNEQWTVQQLQAFAAEKDIDIAGLKLKPEIYAKIQEALAEGSRISFGENE